MRTIIKNWKIGIILIILPLFYFQIVFASNLFYTGGIKIESLGAKIEIDEKAKMEAVYFLANRGEEKEKINLEFNKADTQLEIEKEKLINPVEFNPGDKKSINLTSFFEVEEKITKNLCIDTTLLFDGKPNAKPVGSVLIKVLLPSGINKIVTANKEFKEEGLENGRKFYLWAGNDIYPTTLCLKWSTLKIDLETIKDVDPKEITEPNQAINVKIEIKNRGDSTVKNIILSDQYILSNFEAIQPLAEFKKEDGMLLWAKKIDSLKAGESKTFSYSLKYRGFNSQTYEFDLKPVTVSIDGNLISVSNTVRMKQIGKETPLSEVEKIITGKPKKEIHFPSIPLIFEIGIVLLIIGTGYFIWKKKNFKKVEK